MALLELTWPPVSLQALPYVCLLIAMLFFIYAIIGMQVGAKAPFPVCCPVTTVSGWLSAALP